MRFLNLLSRTPLLMAAIGLIGAGCGAPESDSTIELVQGAETSAQLQTRANTTLNKASDATSETAPQTTAGGTPLCTKKQLKNIKPTLKCEEAVPGQPGVFRAHFGYTNTNPAACSIPVATTAKLSANLFLPEPFDRGQPTVFQKGTFPDVVQVTYKSNTAPNIILWALGSGIAVATKDSPKCPCPASCDDGNSCTVDACSASTNFACTHTPVTNGTTCNDSNACTTGDSCQAGACTGTPKVCTASDQCHDAGTCNTTTGVCSNPAKANGSACNDGNACSQTDTCQGGTCSGGNPKVCTASDQCHVAGTCNPSTGTCSNPSAADGTGCSDGNTCTTSDHCTAGTCGGTAVVCTTSDQCHSAGSCDRSTGLCTNPAVADGTSCTDSNACTNPDSCQAGVCTGGASTVCTASDQCHMAGTCNPATGTCSNPAAADGTACSDGNGCTQSDVCTAGSCTPGTAKSCNFGLTCNPSTGNCPAPVCATEQWDRLVPSPLVGGVNGLNSDGLGNLYVTGGYGDTIDLGSGPISSAGSADAYVARLNPATGLAVWTRSFGDAADQSGTGVAEDGAGHLVVVGTYTGTLDVGGSVAPISSTADAQFAVGLDAATGAALWARSIDLSGGAGGGALVALATDPVDHSVVVVGATPGTGANADFGNGPVVNPACDPTTTACGSDVVVAKLDGATGAVTWARQVGGALNQTPTSVAVDATGGVFVFGRYNGSLDFGGSALATLPSAATEMFLVKLDGMTGAGITGRQLGTRGSQAPGGVAVDGGGNVVISGGFAGTVNFGSVATPVNLVSAGQTDIFAAKYDNTLAINAWAVSFGDANAQAAQAVDVDGAGNVVIGGLFEGVIDFGAAGVVTSAGNTDAFVAKLFGPTGAAMCARGAGDAAVQATSGVTINRMTNEEYLLGNFLSTINWGGSTLVGKPTTSSTFILKLN